MKTGVVIDPRYMNHIMTPFHPESPKRIETVLKMLENASFPFLKITPRAACEEEIQWVHSKEYTALIKSTAGEENTILDPDTSTSALSYETALLAAGGTLKGLDLIQAGKIHNGFALVRPPGHHAEASRAMGFCLFNNVAIGAEYLLRNHGLKKILVIDWDIHHGNGTQNAFYNRDDVLYFSIHMSPHYPGTGHWSETGEGPGEGYNINIPLSSGKNNADYLYIIKNILTPIADSYKPEFILVSAGFDIGAADMLGGMEITNSGFGALAREIIHIAHIHSNEKILFVLEGGYDLNTIQQGTRESLLQLNGNGSDPGIKPDASQETKHELNQILIHLKKYWKI